MTLFEGGGKIKEFPSVFVITLIFLERERERDRKTAREFFLRGWSGEKNSLILLR